jgi:hypothetical protein
MRQTILVRNILQLGLFAKSWPMSRAIQSLIGRNQIEKKRGLAATPSAAIPLLSASNEKQLSWQAAI